MSNKRIWLSPPHMGENELKYVNEAFDSNWISPAGPQIDMFESLISEYVGSGFSVAALSSGTAAIHLALIILGVKEGDEVICPSFTFAGTSNPILYQGAKPVFVDSEHETWNMDPVLLEEAIEDRIKRNGATPKAIIVVDLYGMPAKMKEIIGIAEKYNIAVIEDAAEALGSSYFDQKCGTFGDIGVFSFNGNKIITTSGGGALLSQNEEWVKHSRFLATQARDPGPYYQHSQLGFNYRLSGVSAAIGRGQMEVLDDRVLRRREIYDLYKDGLNDTFSYQDEPQGHFSNRWLTTVLLDNGKQRVEKIRKTLEGQNIELRHLWKPMHLQPLNLDFEMYGGAVSEELFENGLCLPSGTAMSNEDISSIIKCINEC